MLSAKLDVLVCEKSLSELLSSVCLMDEVHAKSDGQLLCEFARHGEEAALRELVTRHADFVYSSALRQVESSAEAADLVQQVFASLAHKTRSLTVKIDPGGSARAGAPHDWPALFPFC